MSTTLLQVKERALSWSSANGLATLANDAAEIINRIAADERSLFDLALSMNSDYFAAETAVTSSSGSSGRTIVTAALSPLVGRIIKFTLASGSDVNQVDVRDLDAELAPRYYMLGTVLKEVSNDWSAASGTVAGTIFYVKRPAVLDTTGALTQTITLDDQFADILEMKLAHYLAHKDVGREAVELSRLEAMIASRMADFTRVLEQFGGVASRRFNQPTTGGKR